MSCTFKPTGTHATNLEVLGDFTDQPLEGELPNQEFGGLLVPPDLTEGDRSGPEPVGLLYTSGRGLESQQDKTNTERQRIACPQPR